MKKTTPLVLLLILAMLFSLCACGSEPAQESAPAEQSTVSAEAPAPEVPDVEASAEEPAEEVSIVEEEPQVVIEYPIEGGYNLTMVACKNNVTASIFGDGGFEQTEVYARLSEVTGVTMEFTMLAEQTVSEKVNLIIASGDLPDLFNSKLGQYESNYIGAIQDEVIIDLIPYLEEYAPDYVRFLERYPDVKASSTNGDGTMAAFVSSAVPIKSKGLNIRRDWLEDLGMEAPTTLDELTDVLAAFKSEKGASLPLLVTSDLDGGIARYFNVNFTGFGSVGYQMLEVGSDEVVPVYAHENFIEYLSYMRDLYEAGLLNNDFLTTGRGYGNFDSTYYSGKSGVWDDGYPMYSDVNLGNGEGTYDPMPFNLSGEEPLHVSDVSALDVIASRIFVSATCENPEVAAMVFNYCYTEDGQILTNFGVENVSWEYNDEGEIVFTELVTHNPEFGMMVARAYYTGMWLPVEGMERALELNTTERGMEAIKLWTEGAGDTSMLIPRGVALGAEEQTEFASLGADVVTAIQEACYKVVTNEGGYSIDDYRALLDELQGTGLARMTELYQEAYDNFMAA